MTMEQNIIEFMDCRINALIGQASLGKKDVLLLHGASFEATTWKELGTLELLSEAGHRAVAIDLPGYGQSAPCSSDLQQVLEKTITDLDLTLPVLIGPSMGGKVALDFIISNPELVGGLVLVGATGARAYADHLSLIEVPTLLVWGSEDQISSLENGSFLETEINDSKLVIFHGAGHPCYLDQPDRWHDELLGFLQEKFS